MTSDKPKRVRPYDSNRESRYEILLTPPGQDYYVPYWLQRRAPQWLSMIPKGLIDRRWRSTYYASCLNVDEDAFMDSFIKVFRENVSTRGLIGDELQEVVDDATTFVLEILKVIDSWDVDSLEDARSVIEDSTYEWASEAHRAFDVALEDPSVLEQDE